MKTVLVSRLSNLHIVDDWKSTRMTIRPVLSTMCTRHLPALAAANILAAVCLSQLAHAACPPMANGSWSLRQSNGYIVDLQTTVDGASHFRGTATVRRAGTRGNVEGDLRGNWARVDSEPSVSFLIRWANGSVGEYYGQYTTRRSKGKTFAPFSGTTTDRATKGRAGWNFVNDPHC
jgi:hypothetical protein